MNTAHTLRELTALETAALSVLRFADRATSSAVYVRLAAMGLVAYKGSHYVGHLGAFQAVWGITTMGLAVLANPSGPL